jgi:predicted nucleotidyltransferase
VNEVRILEGLKVNDIEEVVSFEGFFSGLASNNESIRVKGNLETVTGVRSGKKYHRVVVGSKNVSSPEYIIPISQLKEEI